MGQAERYEWVGSGSGVRVRNVIIGIYSTSTMAAVYMGEERALVSRDQCPSVIGPKFQVPFHILDTFIALILLNKVMEMYCPWRSLSDAHMHER